MKKYLLLMPLLLLGAFSFAQATKPSDDLKIVFIRHGEKPEKGGNLTCKGLNRSLLIPAMITKKFGLPNFIYVPSLGLGEKTKHARMFETVIPLAAKYNIDIDSKFEEKDSTGIANDVMQKNGTVLVVWEHGAIGAILHALGVQNVVKWASDDFDTIYIITFKDGKPVVAKDSEGLNPSEDCPN